jgi:5-deoxy-glucuronate isomerase
MPYYFESVPSAPGLNRPSSNPCKLLDLGYLILNDGENYQATTGGREVLAVLLGGKGTFTVNPQGASGSGQQFANVGGRPNVFSGKPHSVYIPCQSSFTIAAQGRLEVALCSAPSDLVTAPYVIGPERITTGVWGAANFSRNYHQILTLAGQPDLPAKRLIVGETYTPSGNWSTFPPHRHEKDDLPREAYHEEMYFFKVSPPDGFGLTRYYNDEVDTGYVVRDNTILMAPKGYHTVVSAPGYTTYYLWALAGNHRIQATADDPALAWVSRTVPMLKALGH